MGHQFLDRAIGTCTELGFIAHKIAGPSTCITLLGIELDSVHSQLWLPQEKLLRLKEELQCWSSSTKRQLLSLIGMLSYTSKVIRSGRSFFRHLIDLSTSVSELHHHIQLCQQTVAWWQAFGLRWNGVSFLTSPAPSLTFSSDASGSWRCSVFMPPQWFSLQWPNA